MTDADLLYLEQLQEQRNIKLQLIPHALKLGSLNVKNLIRDVDTLYRYVARVEIDEPKKCTVDEVYKQFGVKPYANTEYDRGDVDSLSETVSPKKSQDIYLPKKLDNLYLKNDELKEAYKKLPDVIELDCEYIKFEQCNDACDCVDVCEGVTEKEEIKSWNTEEFKQEFKEFLDKLLILEAGNDGRCKLFFNEKDDKFIVSDEYNKLVDKYNDMLQDEAIRKTYHKLLTTKDWNREHITQLATQPSYAIPCSFDEISANYKKMKKSKNKEDLFESYMKEVYEPSNKKQIKSVPVKKSYFEEWDKERTLRLSQPQETNEQQLLLSI